MEMLTVRETIEFAAMMKLRGSDKEKLLKVDSIIAKLKLEKCQHTLIGGTFSKGISGGEKKRTNIGVELVTDPGFIVLDEPTSGLDSFTALVIISLLKKMAKQEGKTVIFTIHQPSSEIYNALDRILLVRSGETVYQGKAQDVMKYISNQGTKLPEYFNPADFFMELLSQKQTSKG